MRHFLLAVLFVASVAMVSTEDPITPEPATAVPVTIDPDKHLPGIANLLGSMGISDAHGAIRKIIKFFTNQNMRNESATAFNGIRQGMMDGYSCFRQKFKAELKDQQGITAKIVSAMHMVVVPAVSPDTNSTDDDVMATIDPELNIIKQIWKNDEFQEAYKQLRASLMTSAQEGMRCLRKKLKTVRKDVEWILGNVFHTFHPSTTASNIQTTTPMA